MQISALSPAVRVDLPSFEEERVAGHPRDDLLDEFKVLLGGHIVAPVVRKLPVWLGLMPVLDHTPVSESIVPGRRVQFKRIPDEGHVRLSGSSRHDHPGLTPRATRWSRLVTSIRKYN